MEIGPRHREVVRQAPGLPRWAPAPPERVPQKVPTPEKTPAPERGPEREPVKKGEVTV